MFGSGRVLPAQLIVDGKPPWSAIVVKALNFYICHTSMLEVLRCAPRADVSCTMDGAEWGAGGRSVLSVSPVRNGGTAERWREDGEQAADGECDVRQVDASRRGRGRRGRAVGESGGRHRDGRC